MKLYLNYILIYKNYIFKVYFDIKCLYFSYMLPQYYNILIFRAFLFIIISLNIFRGYLNFFFRKLCWAASLSLQALRRWRFGVELGTLLGKWAAALAWPQFTFSRWSLRRRRSQVACTAKWKCGSGAIWREPRIDSCEFVIHKRS